MEFPVFYEYCFLYKYNSYDPKFKLQDTSILFQFTNKFFIIFISILKFHELLFHYFASARERNTAIGGILTQFDQFGTKTLLGYIFKGIRKIIYSRYSDNLYQKG